MSETIGVSLDPTGITTTVTAVATAITETMKFLGTPQGQALVAQSITNGQNFETAVINAGTWLQKLFTGKL